MEKGDYKRIRDAGIVALRDTFVKNLENTQGLGQIPMALAVDGEVKIKRTLMALAVYQGLAAAGEDMADPDVRKRANEGSPESYLSKRLLPMT